jgi:hypothetical protein
VYFLKVGYDEIYKTGVLWIKLRKLKESVYIAFKWILCYTGCRAVPSMVGGSPLQSFFPELPFCEGSDALCMSGKYKEGLHMLTLEDFIAVLGLCASMFALGYAVGQNNIDGVFFMIHK